MSTKHQPFTSRQHMISRTFEIYRYRDTYMNEVALHHHDFYELYLFISGSVNYSIESRNYHLSPGDILLISPNELHQPTFGRKQQSYERFVIWIDKGYLQEFTALGYDLTQCFDTSLPGHTNLLHPDNSTRQILTVLLDRILLELESDEFGGTFMAELCMAQLMLLINRLASRSPKSSDIPDKSSDLVAGVLEFINEHYAEDLSLDLLANKFFISKYHLSREFNRLVGTTVHRYITQKRLAISKQLLSEGIASSAVYQHCGFGDYSNFYRAFKTEYQLSPKEYVEHLKNDAPSGLRPGLLFKNP